MEHKSISIQSFFLAINYSAKYMDKQNRTPLIYKHTLTFDRFFWGVEVGTCNDFLFLQGLLNNGQSQ